VLQSADAVLAADESRRDPPNLRQVVAHTTELGSAERVGCWRDVSWNLSIFRTLLRDDIFASQLPSVRDFSKTSAIPAAKGRAGVNYRSDTWSAYANYSFVQATFRSPLTVPSPSNPFRTSTAISKSSPAIICLAFRSPPQARWRLQDSAAMVRRATLNLVSSFYYVETSPTSSLRFRLYRRHLHTTYKPIPHFEVFASINNLFNRKYATWGILSDPTASAHQGSADA